MLSLGEEKKKEFESALFGKETEVLFEEKASLEGRDYWVGHTKEYVKLALYSQEDLENKLISVTVINRRVQGILLCQIPGLTKN